VGGVLKIIKLIFLLIFLQFKNFEILKIHKNLGQKSFCKQKNFNNLRKFLQASTKKKKAIKFMQNKQKL
jgi:hypothetical protein